MWELNLNDSLREASRGLNQYSITPQARIEWYVALVEQWRKDFVVLLPTVGVALMFYIINLFVLTNPLLYIVSIATEVVVFVPVEVASTSRQMSSSGT